MGHKATFGYRIAPISVAEVSTKKIIEVAQTGLRDSNEICRLTLARIGVPRSE
jgi:hypothetical protein